MQWLPQCELDDPVIEERHPRFQAAGHGGAVHLDEDVVGQVGLHVPPHHALRQCRAGQVFERWNAGGGAQRRPLHPLRHRAEVSVLARTCADELRQAGHLLAQRRWQPRSASRTGEARDGIDQAGRCRPHGRCHCLPQPLRPALQVRLHELSEQVAVVAAEQFIAGVARQRDGDVPARELAQQHGGHLRRVGEGFVVDAGQARHHAEHIGGRDQQLGVFGPQLRGGLARRGELVVAGIAESHREGAHTLRRGLLHQRDDQRGVDAAGQERTQGHVRQHLLPDAALQQSFEFREARCIVALVRSAGLRIGQRPRQRPVRLGNREIVRRTQHEEARRRQLADAGIGAV